MIRYAYVWLIVLLFPALVFAECPTGVQETVVIYLNGVDTTKKSAMESKKRIKEEVSKIPDILTDCIKYDYLYNVNEKLFGDLIEAGLQKAKEQNLSASDFWRWLFRVADFPIASVFLDLLPVFYGDTNLSIDLGLFVLGDQVEEHLAKIREYLNQGKRIIIVSHSQGNLYINEEWNQLTSTERSKINVVAVATPANHTSGNGPYTTLVEDKVAEFFFPRALAANLGNDEPCGSDWNCHGFKESYMRGTNSRSRIADQIVSLLPVVQENCRIEGTIYNWDNSLDYPGFVSGARIVLWRNIAPYDIVLETTSNDSGRYCIANADNGFYFVEAYKNSESLGGRDVWLRSTQTTPIVIDFPIAYLM